jgi:hypothetical protein
MNILSNIMIGRSLMGGLGAITARKPLDAVTNLAVGYLAYESINQLSQSFSNHIAIGIGIGIVESLLDRRIKNLFERLDRAGHTFTEIPNKLDILLRLMPLASRVFLIYDLEKKLQSIQGFINEGQTLTGHLEQQILQMLEPQRRQTCSTPPWTYGVPSSCRRRRVE